jgi:hypothetical protein
MTQLDIIGDAIAKLEATVEDAKTPVAGPLPAELTSEPAPQRSRSTRSAKAPKAKLRGNADKKRPRTKRAVLLALMTRKSGATIPAMMEATGWQAPSVRAGLTGLRKGGATLQRSTNRKGETIYCVVQETAAP